ncbi:MAG: hypothetical protein U0163_09575 [Gemmatimonadaceae bacterium]
MKAGLSHDGSSLGGLVRRFLHRAIYGREELTPMDDEFKSAHLFSISEMERERYAGRRYKHIGRRTTPVFSRPLGVPSQDAEVELERAVAVHSDVRGPTPSGATSRPSAGETGDHGERP